LVKILNCQIYGGKMLSSQLKHSENKNYDKLHNNDTRSHHADMPD